MLERARPRGGLYNSPQAVKRTIGSRLRCRLTRSNAIDFERFTPGAKEPLRVHSATGRREADRYRARGGQAPEKGFDLLERSSTRVRAEHPGLASSSRRGSRGGAHYKCFRASLGDAVVVLGQVEDDQLFSRALERRHFTSRARSIAASPKAVLEEMAASAPGVATAVGGVQSYSITARKDFWVMGERRRAIRDYSLELLRAPFPREVRDTAARRPTSRVFAPSKDRGRRSARRIWGGSLGRRVATASIPLDDRQAG